MAEQVQLHLEARLPELHDLLQRGIFDEHEVRDIVAQRRRFEYRLKRPAGVLLEDYAAYIAYEKSLETLRGDRVRERGLGGTRSLCDYALLQHIYVLYHRALARFGGNAALWEELLLFARAQNSRQVFARACARAVQLHPRHAPLWIAAAEWHFHANGNMPAARAVMQKALVLNPASVEIWLSFFGIELAFASALLSRHAALGIAKSPGNDAGADIDFASIGDSREGSVPAVSAEDVSEDAALDMVVNGSLALIVFEHCLQQLGETLTAEHVSAFLCAARSFSAELHLRAVALLPAAAPGREQFVHAVALSHVADACTPETVQAALRYLDATFAAVATPGILAVCLDFLRALPARVDEASRALVRDMAQEKAHSLYEAGAEAGILTPRLFLQWLQDAVEWGLSTGEAEAICAMAAAQHPSDPEIASARLALQAGRCAALSDLQAMVKAAPKLLGDARVGSAVVQQAVSLMAGASRDAVVSFASFYLGSAHKVDQSTAAELLRAACRSSGCGVEAVRAICKSVANARLFTADMYRAWLSVEREALPVDVAAVRSLFQKAVASDAADTDTWVAFIRFEQDHGCYSAAARLFERAQRSAADPVRLARTVCDASVDR